jgi:DNA-binding XRE family transcriptional regulator
MTFADQLRFYRDELRLTQAELAKELEVPERTLWDWEKGNTVPWKIAREGAISRLEHLRQTRKVRQ